MIKAYKSEIVDLVIDSLETLLRREKKHLIKTDTIIQRCRALIDLTDEMPEREELLDIGIRQVIQQRLHSKNYFSVQKGYFVNIDTCNNIGYLDLILENKEEVIESKIAVKKKIESLKALNGQVTIVPDGNGGWTLAVSKTEEEVMDDLEKDAV